MQQLEVPETISQIGKNHIKPLFPVKTRMPKGQFLYNMFMSGFRIIINTNTSTFAGNIAILSCGNNPTTAFVMLHITKLKLDKKMENSYK